MSILFNDIIFGPLKSRRFGSSLGINLLPSSYKYCTFNCIYCECGWSKKQGQLKHELFKREDVKKALISKLTELSDKKQLPDNITFAGNGEPTLHPQFEDIINDTIEVRNELSPNSKITVLTNSSLLHKPEVNKALGKIENPVLKLDCGTEEMFQRINNAPVTLSLQRIIDNLVVFKGNKIIQSIFLRGTHKGNDIDNTSANEIELWLSHLIRIKPNSVMIYSIARRPPLDTIERIPKEELELIAIKVRKLGFKAEVY